MPSSDTTIAGDIRAHWRRPGACSSKPAVRPARLARLPQQCSNVRQESAMAAEWTVVPVLAAIFLATLIRSAFGFGEALVAVPLLALVIPVEEAVPLATLVSITVAAI